MERIRKGYAEDPTFQKKFPRYWTKDGDYYFYQGAVIVPDVGDLREEVIRTMHAPRTEGHMGRDKTIQKIKKKHFSGHHCLSK